MHDHYQVYRSSVAPGARSEFLLERKEQIARDQAELQADKDRKLARQRSMDSAPEIRIALWESRHGLSLPRSPDHPLMRFIAESTDLQVEQVRAEQKRRAQQRGAAAR